MRRISPAPIVSFSRDGRVFELGRSGLSPILHKHGSTGLGLAPVEIAKSERLDGDGSVVRGIRYGDRDVFIPLRMEAESIGALSELRRSLNELLAPDLGEVEVRIEDPATGSDRMIRGYYKDGLDGDFGTGYHGYWQNLGLTFECHDPWWLGPERIVELRINPGSKPFISSTVPFFPVMLAQSSVQGVFQVDIRGAGPVDPSWEIVGPGTDLRISNGSEVIEMDGSFLAGQPVLIDTTGEGEILPNSRWLDTSLRSRLFKLERGLQTITVTLVGATTETLVRLTYRERYREGY